MDWRCIPCFTISLQMAVQTLQEALKDLFNALFIGQIVFIFEAFRRLKFCRLNFFRAVILFIKSYSFISRNADF